MNENRTKSREDIIVIKNLSKSFGDIHAVNDLSFKVKSGELFAFLGENGAGKSTTISIMCGQNKKDAGSVFIDGLSIEKDMKKITPKLGVVFQYSVLDNLLSVKDNLLTRACLYGINRKEALKRIDYLAELLDFKDLLKRTVGKLSGGQHRRIDVARALIHDPQILILDEPSTGLDPQTRRKLWSVIEHLRKEKGLTVFLTTHYMEEAADADYVVILDSGKIGAEGTPIDLKNTYSGDFISLYNVDEDKVKLIGKSYEVIPGGFRIAVKNTEEARDLLLKHSDIFIDFEISKGKMDDVFLAVTGKKLLNGEN